MNLQDRNNDLNKEHLVSHETKIELSSRSHLISNGEVSPVTEVYSDSKSPFVFIADHAGCLIPRKLNDLGISASDRYRHIAWDIGIKEVGQHLSEILQATYIHQNYSRLVIDCNRKITSPTSIPTFSDCTSIPGNQELSAVQKEQRIHEIFNPYHERIAQILNQRRKESLPTLFISLHSFTAEMQGKIRPWHAGILYGQSPEYSLYFKKLLEAHYAFPIGDNQPYALVEENDYSVPYHAIQYSLPYLELEIRQDLLSSQEQQKIWAERLAQLLPMAWKEYCHS